MKAAAAPRITRGYGLDHDAIARLKDYGVKVSYCLADGETLGTKFKMRNGETLGVVDGLRTFGRTRKEMHAAIRLVHSWGARIVDVEHNENSRDHMLDMLDRALNFRDLSSERASELAHMSLAARRAKKWPEDKAERAWHSRSIRTAKDFRKLTDWAPSTAHAAFGPRFKPKFKD